MITEVEVRNFKNLRKGVFRLKDRLVIAGLNNSGKTSLLQAIAAWSAFAERWAERNPDLARDGTGSYPGTRLPVNDFHGVPLLNFDHLWSDKAVREPVRIRLRTVRWNIAFEALWEAPELAMIRPAASVDTNDLAAYLEAPPRIVYVPAVSGLAAREPLLDARAIPARLARAQSGSVLRNLLHRLSQDSERWNRLQNEIRECFGYELFRPSPSGAEVYVYYRHDEQSVALELGSAASGFLQVLLLHAALLNGHATLALVDEPDAHLHVWLQERVLRSLGESARVSASQLIVTTHSEAILRVVEPQHLCVLVGGKQRMVSGRREQRTVREAVAKLSNSDVTKALMAPGILYLEGSTDLNILRSWARQLSHRASSFLEQPFWKPTVEDRIYRQSGIKAREHFPLLRIVRPQLPGLELVDSDRQERADSPDPDRTGLVTRLWQRYEIESYLLHPQAIRRFVHREFGSAEAARITDWMKDEFPPRSYRSPLESSRFFRETKAASLLGAMMDAAGVGLEKSDYYRIARQMTPEEIHPEVVEKLDAIASCFGLAADGLGSQRSTHAS